MNEPNKKNTSQDFYGFAFAKKQKYFENIDFVKIIIKLKIIDAHTITQYFQH